MAVTSRLLGLFALVLLAACGETTDVVLSRRSAAPSGPLRWRCPPEWVEHRSGGCGPAVLLCTEGGDAAPGACDGRVLDRPREINVDGQVVQSFFRLPDGRIGGGWSLRAMNPQCPEGWRHAGDGACEPVLPESCPEGSAPAPGGCLALGEAQCASGEWPALPAEARGARVVYVRAGVGCAGEMGGMTCPQRSITEGIRAAGEGGWVLVGAGEYTEALTVTGETHVLGVCATRVVVRAPSRDVSVLDVQGPQAMFELRGISVLGGFRGVSVSRQARASLDKVRVSNQVGQGLFIEEASLSGREVLVQNVRRLGSDVDGAGVFARRNSSVTLGRVVVRDCVGAGIVASARSTVRLTDTLLRNIEGALAEGGGGAAVLGVCPLVERPLEPVPPLGASGDALAVGHGSSLRAARVIIEESGGAGAGVGQVGSLLEIEDGVIRNSRPLVHQDAGHGVFIAEGAHASFTRVLFEANSNTGVSSFCRGTRVTLRDCVIRNTNVRRSNGRSGRGLCAHEGGTLLAQRVAILNSHNFGAYAFNGSTLELSDSLISVTSATSDAYSGGVGAVLDAKLRATHVLVERNQMGGAVSTGTGTVLTLHDVIVRNSERYGAWPGIGIAASGGDTIELDRVAVENVYLAAFMTSPWGGHAELHGDHLFARNIHKGALRVGASSVPSVATAIFVAPGSTIDVQDALLSEGDHGFVVGAPSTGQLSIRRGVFARQRRLGAMLGVEPGVFDTLSLTDVVAVEVGDPYVRNTLD